MRENTIAFIGAGNMAGAIFGGLINQGFDASNIWATASSEAGLERAAALGINTTTDNEAAIAKADVVVLAVKPQRLKEVLLPLKQVFANRNPLIISVAVGIKIASLQDWLGNDSSIVRCMPNTPSLVGRGASGLFASAKVNTAQRQIASDIFDAVGISLWVDAEEQIDAVAAVSGSGPAYFFLLMEAMTAAGTKLGLSPEIADQLTLQTALGAAEMATASDVDAAELRRRVTSPAGTTEAAINSFENNNLRGIVETALEAAHHRSGELAELLGK